MYFFIKFHVNHLILYLLRISVWGKVGNQQTDMAIYRSVLLAWLKTLPRHPSHEHILYRHQKLIC